MTELFSAESIIFNLTSKIELEWVAGQEDPDRPLHEVKVSDHATLIGHLNLIHKNIIQVIGKTECDYMQTGRRFPHPGSATTFLRLHGCNNYC